jgi:mono/diheme cytochrome c family protein
VASEHVRGRAGVLVAVAGAVAIAWSCLSCGGDPRFANLTPVQQQGLKVYRRDCAACHNLNASQEGTQGPPIAGASLELLEARVLRLEYPPGYVPKRETKLMNPKMPWLKDEIPALHAFLDPAVHPAQ